MKTSPSGNHLVQKKLAKKRTSSGWSVKINLTIRANIRKRFNGYGDHWDVRVGLPKPTMTNSAAFQERVTTWAAYCYPDPITCALCTKTLRIIASSSNRMEFVKWNFDHKLDKAIVGRVAKALLDAGQK